VSGAGVAPSREDQNGRSHEIPSYHARYCQLDVAGPGDEREVRTTVGVVVNAQGAEGSSRPEPAGYAG
jgi:hypothetical protein